GPHRAQEKHDQHGDQVLHAYHLVVGGIAEVAPQALVFASQLEFFGWCRLVATKSPFDDAVESSDAYKEEEQPAAVGCHGHCIVVGDHVGAYRGCNLVNKHTSNNSAYHAKYYSRNHAREKPVGEVWTSHPGHSCTGCTAHK